MESMSKTEADNSGYERVYLNERLSTCYSILEGWEPSSDTFSLLYGTWIGMGLTALTPIPLFRGFTRHHSLLRRKIQVGHSFRILPVALPSVGYAGLSYYNVKNILLESPPCSVCHEIRGITSQVILGFGLPILFTFASKGFYLSHKGISIPSPLSKDFMTWMKNVSSHSSKSLSLLFLLHIAFSSILVNHQITSWSNIRAELKRRIDENEV